VTGRHSTDKINGEDLMRYPSSIGAIALAGALMAGSGAWAHDETKYPDWSGQWKRPAHIGNQWDPSKPTGLRQQAPLTPEYQAMFETSLAAQAAGGQGDSSRFTCLTNGMPRIMSVTRPIEFVVLPNVTYLNFEAYMPRRIYTDGRDWPTDEEPTYVGHSIGRWVDEDGDGRFDLLEIESRNFKGPRNFESTGLPMHRDNQTIIKERIFLSKTSKDILHAEITTIDHALTRPWTVLKTYERERSRIIWYEENCNESNNHVVIGKENYFMSADGFLMPAKKDQPPPDLRYFSRRSNAGVE
jgi:hypothetical protein